MNSASRAPLAIVGAGGFARDLVWLIEEIDRNSPQWQIAGFTDLAQRCGQTVGKYRILGDDEWLMSQTEIRDVVISIADPEIRRRVYEKLKGRNFFRFPNLIHPSVRTDWQFVQMGEGNLVLEGAALSVDIRMGSNNVVSKLVAIGHDVVIGDHCVFNTSSALSGHVTVGDGCMLGAGALTYQGVSLAPGVLLGMGSVALQSLPSAGVYFGVPARKVAQAMAGASR